MALCNRLSSKASQAGGISVPKLPTRPCKPSRSCGTPSLPSRLGVLSTGMAHRGTTAARRGVVTRTSTLDNPRSTAPNNPPGSATWTVEVVSHVPLNTSLNVGFELSVMSLATGQRSDPVVLDAKWDTAAPKVDRTRPAELPGRIRTGKVVLPAGFGAPAAVVLNNVPGVKDADGKESSDGSYSRCHVEQLRFYNAMTEEEVSFRANTYIANNQGDRYIVRDDAWKLKGHDRAIVDKLCEDELRRLQGLDDPTHAKAERKCGDRVYDYAPYNDLSANPVAQGTAAVRPTLGGTKNPYPRRLATNRPPYPGFTSIESAPTDSSLLGQLQGIPLLGWVYEKFRTKVVSPWVPDDDNFDADKTVGFLGASLLATLPSIFTVLEYQYEQPRPFIFRSLIGTIIWNLTFGKFQKPKSQFNSISEYLSLYDKKETAKLVDGDGSKTMSPVVPAARTDGEAGDDELDWSTEVQSLLPERKDFGQRGFFTDLLKYEVPYSIDHRVNAWRTDEEFGRVFLAGQNPLVLEALREGLPAGSIIKEEHLAGLLEGRTVAELVKSSKPRLFQVNYWDALIDEINDINSRVSGRVQHAARCILYLRNDGYLVPLAIELASRQEDAPHASGHVYTADPVATPPSVWQLAKAVFNSVDSAWHQLVSHWLRTHCCQEPYLIATRRQLSSVHPVFKLLMPHFRYTMPINANARSLLINANGVIEKTFTPGYISMQLSSKAYAKYWNFDQEALPADLRKRGLMDTSGNLLVDDYPYAEDGLLIWNQITKYFTKYLSLYYKNDAEVQQDKQLQAWWQDIKTKGHPDKLTGWPTVSTLEDLVYVCATMAWVGSAHHSAVNFGQYANSGFMPAHSSCIRQAMPVPGSQEYEAVAKLQGDAFEHAMLGYLSDPAVATQVMSVVKALSSHAADEVYLTTDYQEWITDKAGLEAFNEFVKDMKRVEALIEERNANALAAGKKTRAPAAGGQPYMLLLPSSPTPGATGRGVPYSISI